jgi:hypothetical protein
VTTYERRPSAGYEVVDRWADGLGWFAHSGEEGKRASHAFVGDDGGVWVFDPLDPPVSTGYSGPWVRSPASSSSRTTTSATPAISPTATACRSTFPSGFPGREGGYGGGTEPVTDEIGTSGFTVRRCAPLPGWSEALAYRATDGTLYMPDVLGTAPLFTVGDE